MCIRDRLKTEADMEKMMPKDIPSIIAMNEINRYFGGQDVAYTLVKGDVLEPDNLKAMLKYEDDLASTRYVNENGNPIFERDLSLIHISEPTRLGMISYAVFCLKK